MVLSRKKEQNNAVRSNMGATRDDHAKGNTSEAGRQTPYGSAFTWSLKYATNELIYKTETDSDTESSRLPGGVGDGGSGSRGLADVNHYTQSG